MTTAGYAVRTRLKTDVLPFRPVAVRLLRMMGDPGVAFAEVAALVQTDPMLSVELLRIANSPLLPARMEVRSVLQAIVLLGHDKVGALILTSCLRALVAKRASRFIPACWRHSLATALICQQLSGALRLPESNAYTAGLVHDIGQLALLNVFPEYEEVLVSSEERGLDLLEAERELFGLDHAEAGGWLLAQWGCPLELQNVAARHENPPQAHSRDERLIRLVHNASAMAGLMGMSVADSARGADLLQIAAALPEAAPRLTEEGFGELAESVMTSVNGVEVSLGFRQGE